MASRLNPYLNFNGNARQALEYYASVFGGNLNLSTYADFGDQDSPNADKIMHGQLETDAGYTIMAADTPPGMGYNGMHGFGVSISGDDADALRRYFDSLSDGGAVTMPLQKQAWGDEFGMVTDKFGVPWLLNIGQPQAA
ncbi:MAG: VOC family protein [Streptosporangiaceae bacterium]|nr:VOC family protein [Streptosporangiaceae bacterium]